MSATAERPSLRERSRLRRRARHLRRLRELQLRDLGGLVWELRRAHRSRDDLVATKLEALDRSAEELRALEARLGVAPALAVLREPGIGGTCLRCGTLHGSADAFCAHCGQELHT